MSLKSQIFQGSFAYGLAMMLQRGVGLLMLPLYLRYVTPDEYGSIALVGTVTGAVAAVLGFGLETAIFRTYLTLTDQPQRQDDLLKTLGLFLLIVPNLVVGGVIAVGMLTLDSAMGVPVRYYALGLATATLSITFTTLPFAVLRGRQQLGAYVGLNAASVVAHTTALILGVIVLGGGVTGWLAGGVVAAFLLLLLGLIAVPFLGAGRVDPSLLWPALGYGVPMIPHFISHWGLNLSDRAILAASVSVTSVGVYNFGYSVGSMLGVLFTALQYSMQPYYVRAVSCSAKATSDLALIVSVQAAIVLAVTAAFALLAPPLLSIFSPESYRSVTWLMPWFALGYGLYGLYFVPMNVISLVLGQTRWVWLATAVAALANTGLNLLFVPRYGVEAAAVSTAAGYGVLLLAITFYMLRSGYWISMYWTLLAALAVALGLVYAVARLTGPEDGVSAIAWRCLCLAGLGAAVFALRGPLLHNAASRRRRLIQAGEAL